MAGSDPTFDGFQPPKRAVGSLPAVTVERCSCFARAHTQM